VAEGKRELLESIVYSSDPSIKPGDRLKAMELLHAEDGGLDPTILGIAREVAEMDGNALTKELEGLLREPEHRNRDLHGEVERRVAQRLSALTKAAELPPALEQRVQVEVEARVEQLIADGELVPADAPQETKPKRPVLPPQFPDDPELGRKMEEARRQGRNPFDIPGAASRTSSF